MMKLFYQFKLIAPISIAASLICVVLATNCSPASVSGGAGTGTVASFTGTSFPTIGSTVSDHNVMTITVNGSKCGSIQDQYPNEPCASVTICSTASPTTCQTIDNLLLDTGSYGLRVFKSVITIPLTPITNGSNTLAECAQFGDGSTEFGPVEYAYVQLGDSPNFEPKVAVPILVINDSSYPNTGTPCESSLADTSPQQAGFNGILGVGLFGTDCGDECAIDPNNEEYFTCAGGNCTGGATADALAQVTNPVAALPVDNNGVMMNMPSVAASGVANVTGSLYLGIDTQSNNSSAGTSVALTANGYAQMKSKFSAFSSTLLDGFIDSGSSVLFIPSIGSLPDCGGNNSGLFCPTSPVTLSAINYDSSGNSSPSSSVSFTIDNANGFSSSNMVFSTIAGSSGTDTSAYMDYGLPFFFGRKVYVGIDGASSNLGAGPLWGY